MNIVDILDIVAVVFALLVAIIGHEIMHGRMAYYYGDDTAKNQGRFSINPISHIDPVGTVILPALLYLSHAGFMFGWAKPVPINLRKVVQKGGFLGGFQVALAGIYYNFTIAFISFLLLKTLHFSHDSIASFFFAKFLFYSLIYNIVLGVFNLFPIPPLDGSKALMFILFSMGFYKAGNYIERYSQYGTIILMIVVATPLSSFVFSPIHSVVRYFLSFI